MTERYVCDASHSKPQLVSVRRLTWRYAEILNSYQVCN